MGALDSIFKAYDVRGTVPDQLNAERAQAIGRAVARFCGGERLLVARDMRTSGPELVEAFSRGARSEGVTVVDLGLLSTDGAYFASGSLNAPAAMFTASHNPARYNGLKLCLAGALPIGTETGLAQIQAMAEEFLGQALPTQVLAPLEHKEVLEDFCTHVRSFIDTSSLRPLKVVADTANGMGGLIVPAVMKSLPFTLRILYPELDGNFPNHPADPIQEENLVDLQNAVLETKADIGLAFDGDADRVFLVDEKAQPISGSLTTALVAAAILDRHHGETVLYNCICSKVVRETIEEHGGTGIRTRVGHSFIKKIMAETGAIFAGEHSGHFYYRDNFRADSGIITALIVLELLSKSDKPLSELLAPFRRYVASGEINSEVKDPGAAVKAVADYELKKGRDCDLLDGLTVERDGWWYNLRPSNTEPLLRLNVEADSESATQKGVAEVQSLIASLVK